MSIVCKRIDSIPEFVAAIRLRVEVFIKEQGCEPGWEPDELDKTAVHYALFEGEELLVTGRVRESAPGERKIERMATRRDARGKGYGAALMRFILEDLQGQKPSRIWMQSQSRVVGFYKGFGFRECSDEYVFADIPHIDMERVSDSALS